MITKYALSAWVPVLIPRRGGEGILGGGGEGEEEAAVVLLLLFFFVFFIIFELLTPK